MIPYFSLTKMKKEQTKIFLPPSPLVVASSSSKRAPITIKWNEMFTYKESKQRVKSIRFQVAAQQTTWDTVKGQKGRWLAWIKTPAFEVWEKLGQRPDDFPDHPTNVSMPLKSITFYPSDFRVIPYYTGAAARVAGRPYFMSIDTSYGYPVKGKYRYETFNIGAGVWFDV